MNKPTLKSPEYREASLSPYAMSWLKQRGFEGYAEVPFYTRWIDLVGIRWEDESLIAIELKTCLTHKVIGQAHLNHLITPQSYAGIRSIPKVESLKLAQRCGIGVITLGLCCEVVLEPTGSPMPVNRFKRRDAIEYLKLKSPGGTAGMPGKCGPGPAQRCHTAVVEYVTENPSASWRTIFSGVANHYMHPLSMRGCMLLLERQGKVTDRIGRRPLRNNRQETA